MESYIFDKLEAMCKRYEKINMMLNDKLIIADQKLFRKLSREYNQLKEVYTYLSEWKNIQEDIKITKQIILNDPEIREIAQEDINYAQLNLKKIEFQLQSFLLPKDPNDKNNAFIEIRAGTGGDEASMFVSNLFRMYIRYAEFRCWKTENININENERGGYKEVILKIKGNGAYGRLKFESGGHRVQRIPATEFHGRIHTSACTVAVFPELPEAELPDINLSDLRIDTFRSSGAGGQHVNTTDSAIRVTHLPTGIVVECQDERSQHKNKNKALSVLAARINAAEISKRRKLEESTRRSLLGSGDRNDRNRTYNFQQGRITDHRINLTLYRLNEVMEGKLDILIEPLIQEYLTNQLEILSKKVE